MARLKSIRRSILGLLLIALLGMASAATAKGPIGELKGTVLDSKGQPVANATVTMQSSDGKQPFATHTDANGHFEFARFETGQYDLRAYSKGTFSDWTKRVSIRSKKTTEVTLHMPPAADVSVTVTQ
jgi:uncharacterized membrane protein